MLWVAARIVESKCSNSERPFKIRLVHSLTRSLPPHLRAPFASLRLCVETRVLNSAPNTDACPTPVDALHSRPLEPALCAAAHQSPLVPAAAANQPSPRVVHSECRPSLWHPPSSSLLNESYRTLWGCHGRLVRPCFVDVLTFALADKLPVAPFAPGCSTLDPSPSTIPCPTSNCLTALSKNIPPARPRSTSPAISPSDWPNRPWRSTSTASSATPTRPLEELSDADPIPVKLLTNRDSESLGVLRHSCAARDGPGRDAAV